MVPPGGVPGEPRGTFRGFVSIRGGPGGLLGSLGGPWEAPGGSLGDPGWVLGTALSGFWGDWDKQYEKSMIGCATLPKSR